MKLHQTTLGEVCLPLWKPPNNIIIMNHYFSSAALGQCRLVFSSIKCTSLHHGTAMEPVLHQNRLRKPLRPQLSVIPWMGDELMSWLWLLLTSTCMHLLQLLAEGSTMNFPFFRGELFKGEQRNKGEKIVKYIFLSVHIIVCLHLTSWRQSSMKQSYKKQLSYGIPNQCKPNEMPHYLLMDRLGGKKGKNLNKSGRWQRLQEDE